MQLQTQKRYYTPEEYLELEEKADYKHEYRDGEIVPMTGGTTNHNEIALNVAANLKFDLRGQNYTIEAWQKKTVNPKWDVALDCWELDLALILI